MVRSMFNIWCYADDAVMISENLDDYNAMWLNSFKRANITKWLFLLKKTQTMTITKEPLWCKIVINNALIE